MVACRGAAASCAAQPVPVGSNERTPGLTRPVPRRRPLQLRSHWPIRGMALRGGDGWETPALVVLVLVVDLLKRDYRGIVRTQRMRHIQPTISLFLFKSPRAPPKKPGTTTGTRGARLIPQDAQKQKETRGRKRKEANPTKRKSGSSWPVLVADWAACFLSTSPAVSIFITTAVQEDHQSACMVEWG